MPSQPAIHRAPAPHVLPEHSFELQRQGIILVLALFMVLGCLYSIATPIFEASDEIAHYPFVKHLADGHGLPVLRADQLGAWKQEGGQPPLYYALGALLTRGVDTSDFEAVHKINPHADIGVIKADGNANMVIHSSRERFPYRGTALAVHIVRWASVLMGAVTVWAAYALACALGVERTLAVSAAAITAFNPMFLFITSSVNNDALVTMLCALSLWLMVRYVSIRPTIAQWIMLGVLLGCAVLTKTSALAMLPLAGLAVIVVARRQRSWRELFIAALTVGLPVIAISGWWFYRNWQLYHDPLGLSAFIAVIGKRHPTPTLLQLMGEWPSFFQAYWGFFGGMNVPAPQGVYLFFGLVTLVGLIGALLWLIRQRRALSNERRWLSLALVILWPTTVFIALVRWTLMTPASQGRLMFPALTALSLLMAIGLDNIAPRRFAHGVLDAVCAAMLAIAALLPFVTILPTYAPPPALQIGDVAELSPRVNAVFGGGMRLLGYEVDRLEATPGDSVAITLYWEALAPMNEDYSVFVHILGAHDLIIGQRDRYPGRGNLPTSLWSPGQIVADTFIVPIAPTVMTPVQARYEVGFYNYTTGERLPVVDYTGATRGDCFRFGHLLLPSRVVDGIPNPVFFNLDNRGALGGYDIDGLAAEPGESLHLILYWRALADLDTNYSVFTQIVGEQNNIWAQKDGWPQDGDAPTATWRAGQLIEDSYKLTIKQEAPVGTYDLMVGMYDAEGKRLSVLGEGGYVQDTRIVLGQVRVMPEP